MGRPPLPPGKALTKAEITKRYNDRHRTEVRQRNARWRTEHADQHRESERAWYKANPEKVRQYRQAQSVESRRAKYVRWALAHPDRVRELARQSRSRNHEVSVARSAARRARSLSRFTVSDVVAVYGADCGICGAAVDVTMHGRNRMSVSLDHVVPLARGGEHVIANLRVAHFGCNASKGAREFAAKGQ